MKIQIVVDGQTIDTQLVPAMIGGLPTTPREAKRAALKAALDDSILRPSEALKATFLIFDDVGNAITSHR